SSHSHTQSTYTIFISPFYASVLHQDLHSFPTRRSSDLTNQFATDGQTIFLAMRGKSDEPTLWDMRDLQRVFERFIKPFLKNVELDRKSTRLNSSHVSISYAVFCLKKKKKYTYKIIIEHK